MSETGVRTFEGAWGLSSGAAIGQKQSVMHDRIQPIAEIGDEACRLDRRGAASATGEGCLWCSEQYRLSGLPRRKADASPS